MRPAILLILLWLPFSAVAAEPLGRLFMTPAERASLDLIRQNTSTANLNEQEVVPETAVRTPDSISIQGYVKRSDGRKSTVWINNSPIQENQGNAEVQVGKLGKDSNQVQVTLPASGKSVNLKAGQTYDSATDSVRDVNAKPAAVPAGKKQPKVEDGGTIGLENLPEEVKRQLYPSSPGR